MFRALFILGFLLLMAGGARVDTPDISLGPAILTFPEIARQLNTQGRHILYDASLRDRAAYVYLKQRRWADVQALLSESLEIRFRPKQNEPNTWIMEPDSSIQAREDRWLKIYADNIRYLVNRMLKPAQPYLDLSYAAARNEWQTLMAEIDAARKDGSLEDSGQAEKFMRIGQQCHDLQTATEPGLWFAAHLIRAGLLGDPTDILQGKYSFQVASMQSLVDENSLPALQKMMDRLEGDALVVYGWDYNTEYAIPFVNVWFIAPDGRDALADFNPGDYRATGMIFDGILPPASFYPGLGEEAQKWLLEQRTETRAFLNTDIAKKHFTVRSAARAKEITSVSEVIESWSREMDAEAVMELWPIREDGRSLAYLMTFPSPAI